ncbi:hypothetical protein K0M31_012534 [Melipona bicolor]|uniref:Transposase n=1 Tax=Melipona bicolor TaxID=60889 RepID=A0AA40FJB8_9HYME|nr:hypothetical protein K0M31_012534 [Melipona bicolor]
MPPRSQNSRRASVLLPNCLRRGHSLSECRSGACKVCQQRHHTMLHDEKTLLGWVRDRRSSCNQVLRGRPVSTRTANKILGRSRRVLRPIHGSEEEEKRVRVHYTQHTRRGKAKHLFSDNAKTFVGANRELRKIHSQVINSTDAILRDYLNRRTGNVAFYPTTRTTFRRDLGN